MASYASPRKKKTESPAATRKRENVEGYLGRVTTAGGPIAKGLWVDNQAKRAVNMHLDGGYGIELTAEQKRTAILEMMYGWTVAAEEKTIIRLLENVSKDEYDIIFDRNFGVDRKELLAKFQGKNADRLRALLARHDAEEAPGSSYVEHLHRALEQAGERDHRRRELEERRAHIAKHREQMDKDSVTGDYPRKAMEDRRAFEKKSMQDRRLEPITKIEVTEEQISLHINFEIRFEGVPDEVGKSRFPAAKNALSKGIDKYWNHVIGSDVVGWNEVILGSEPNPTNSDESAVRYTREPVPPPPPQRADETFEEYLQRVRKDYTTIHTPMVNPDMANLPFVEREFSIIPTVKWIPADQKSDPSRAWLFSIRPSEAAPLAFEGIGLEDAETDDLENKGRVTMTLVERGVVSMSPVHANKPLTYAHEMLHLFGLVDRYGVVTVTGDVFAVRTERMTENLNETGEERVTTGGRPDPLGLEPGPVLDEDLMHILSGTGVFEQEIYRGLDDIRRLDEARGHQVTAYEIEVLIDRAIDLE